MRAACDAGIVAGVAAGFFIPTTVSVGSCWFDGADTAASTRGLRVGASVGASPGGGDNSLTGFLGRNNSSAASRTDAWAIIIGIELSFRSVRQQGHLVLNCRRTNANRLGERDRSKLDPPALRLKLATVTPHLRR